MALPKSPIAEPSDAELLSALTSAPEVANTTGKAEVYTYDIINFLKTFGIAPGKHRVKFRLLYELYVRWSPTPATETTFGLWLGKFLEKTSKTSYIYFVNKKAFSVAEALVKYVLPKPPPSLKNKNPEKHFENFLRKYQLKRGRCWVEGYCLYYLYDKWCYAIKKKRPLTYAAFLTMLKTHFSVKDSKRQRSFLVGVTYNIRSHITHEEMMQIHQGKNRKNKQHAPKSKGANTPKHREIPSTRTQAES